MSEFLTAPVARPQPEPNQGRSLETLATVLVITIAIGVLYVGREIFVPIAIAILLSFVLSPLVRMLRRIGVKSALAVGIVVLAGLVVAVAAGAVLTKEFSDLATELPQYEATVSGKIERLRATAANSPLIAKMSSMLVNVERLAPGGAPAQPAPPTNARKQLEAAGSPPPPGPVPVRVIQEPPSPLVVVQAIAGTALSPLAMIGIVTIFLIFILLQRQDLRDRFIRLVGAHDLQRTTNAMNDAAGRLSRYFLMQTIVNACFGMLITAGLWLIGVPSPVLWGTVAFLMRFVPYIGALVAAIFPVALATAVDPGWTKVVETAALFLITEPVIGQVVEPFLYGHNTGISPIAVVVSATFWTWLWGPIGLVLSTPLTVCLVVLGRHVERLEFLDVIFGDAPPLSPVESFYQRVLAGDASEVSVQAEQFLREHRLAEYYDEIALQGLLLAQIDVRRGVLDPPRQKRMSETVLEVMEDLADHTDEAPEPAEKPEPEPEAYASLGGVSAVAPSHGQSLAMIEPADLAPNWQSEAPVLCIAGQGPLDEAVAGLLAQLLQKHGIGARVEPAEALTVRNLSELDRNVRMVCLSYLDADISMARARFAIRRLRRRIPDAIILTGFWMAQGDDQRTRQLCEDVKSDLAASSLTGAVSLCIAQATAPRDTGETDSLPERDSGTKLPSHLKAHVA